MPRIPEQEVRRLFIESLEEGASGVAVPSTIERAFDFAFRADPATPWLKVAAALRSITPDTRKAGVPTGRFKIQKTGLDQVSRLDVLLGIRLVGEQVVFVAFDPKLHVPATGGSDAVQFPESLVTDARQAGVALTHRSNGEPIFAFTGDHLVEFLLGHLPGAPFSPSLSALAHAPPGATRVVVRRALARDPVFRSTVIAAYSHRCGGCGISLDLVEAAHVVPHRLSADNHRENGVCLCPTHHTAFDTDLITFDAARKIWICKTKVEELVALGRADGLPLVLDSLFAELTPVSMSQAAYLSQRWDLSTREPAEWVPRSRGSRPWT